MNMFKNSNKIIALTLFYLAISLFIYRDLLKEGYIINSDFTRAENIEGFLEDFIPLWNEKGSYTNVFRLSKLFIYAPLFLITFLKIDIKLSHVYLIYFSFLSTISAISMHLLAKYIIFHKNKYSLTLWEELPCISSALFYILSTYVVEQVTHPAIKYAFYLSPLILLTFIMGMNENRKKVTMISALISSFAAADIHWPVFGTVVIVTYTAYSSFWEFFIERKGMYSLKKNFSHLIIFFNISLLLNSYWLIPLTFSRHTPIINRYFEQLKRDPLCTFRYATIVNLFAMKGNVFLLDRYRDLPSFLTFLRNFNLNIFLLILTGIGILSLLLSKSKQQLFWELLYLIAFFLSAGPNLKYTPFYWLITDIPFSFIYSWAFRTPKFHQFLILALAPLVALTAYETSQLMRYKNPKLYKIFLLTFLNMILLFSFVSNYPLLTGDFNGNLRPIEIPQDYKDAVSYLKGKKGYFKVIWGPPFKEKTSWHINRIGDLTDDISPKPTLSYLFNDFNKMLLFGEDSLIYNNETIYISKFYSPLSVRYILIHDDIPLFKSKISLLLKHLRSQVNLKLVKKIGFISIFELIDTADIISTKDINLLIFDRIVSYNSLTYIRGFNPIKVGVIYHQVASSDSSEVLKICNSIVLKEKPCINVPLDVFQDKNIIYLFEAEHDLYKENATIQKIGGLASNGKVLIFNEFSRAWKRIEIIKNGTYQIALRGVGDFKVKIGSRAFILSSKLLELTYTPEFYLKKGTYYLEISSLSSNSILDIIWLYSTTLNRTIDRLFEINNKSARILNYIKINPTLWNVKISAFKPFMLCFAESYDPLWEARIYKNGKKVKVAKSIPLYSVINGFWIDETGELEIVIRYKPQDWFELGLAISAMTFTLCIFYLIWDWRRSRGDRWALGLEKVFRRALTFARK